MCRKQPECSPCSALVRDSRAGRREIREGRGTRGVPFRGTRTTEPQRGRGGSCRDSTFSLAEADGNRTRLGALAPTPVLKTGGPTRRPDASRPEDTTAASPESKSGWCRSRPLRLDDMEAAFFDLDKTIISKSSSLALSRPMYRAGMVSRGQLLRGAYAQLVYLLVGADEKKMERLKDGLLALTKGWD